MYKQQKLGMQTFENLKKEKIWEKTKKIYEKYRKRWNGPDIPVFIFPLDETNRVLVREGKSKSGVSFTDKMFLFLTALEDEKNLEALIIHEYHHVCRMNKQKKNPMEYTLLDSIILEGFAEHAVEKYCGREYTGEWSKRYSKEELGVYWEKEIKNQLLIKRDHRLHDQILFGQGMRPALLGYAIGYEIVKQYKEMENFSDKTSFAVQSSYITKFVNF